MRTKNFVALLALIALAGCSQPADTTTASGGDAAKSPSPSASASPSASPSTTPTAPPDIDKK